MKLRDLLGCCSTNAVIAPEEQSISSVPKLKIPTPTNRDFSEDTYIRKDFQNEPASFILSDTPRDVGFVVRAYMGIGK